MKRFGLTPLLVLAAIATALLVGARLTPYFPGDVALGRWIQSVAPPGDWARAVTRAAYAPWVYGVLAVSDGNSRVLEPATATVSAAVAGRTLPWTHPIRRATSVRCAAVLAST